MEKPMYEPSCGVRDQRVSAVMLLAALGIVAWAGACGSESTPVQPDGTTGADATGAGGATGAGAGANIGAGATGGLICSADAGLQNCNGQCVDVASDPLNCGMCAVACAQGQVCSLGVCGSTGCAANLTQCGASCVDLNTSVANCGQCGLGCAAGQSCVNGMCACDNGGTLCNAACVLTDSDPFNCGGCGVVCQNGAVCTAGQCTGGNVGTGGAADLGTGGADNTGGLQNTGGATDECVDVEPPADQGVTCSMAAANNSLCQQLEQGGYCDVSCGRCVPDGASTGGASTGGASTGGASTGGQEATGGAGDCYHNEGIDCTNCHPASCDCFSVPGDGTCPT